VIPAVRPVRTLEKDPVPLPSLVLVLRAIVGDGEVSQTTPRAVTGSSPSEIISPPLFAVVSVMAEIAVVLTVDVVGVKRVVKVSSGPYEVPKMLVA
jgi:hypothetical protein